MENNDIKKLSRAAIEEYKQRLDELKNVTRLEVAQQIKEARAFGDISENAEYDAAMDHQSRIEAEIARLEELLANVEEIDEESIDFSVVNVGARVRVVCDADGLEETYDIVSTSESEPFARTVVIDCDNGEYNGRKGYAGRMEVFMPAKISNESLVGRSLLGHRAGETVDIITPQGSKDAYKVLEITRIPDVPRGKIIRDEVAF